MKVLSVLLFIFVFTPVTILSAGEMTSDTSDTSDSGASLKIENPVEGLTGGEEPDVNVMIGSVIQVVLGIVGSLALLAFVYGGLVLMTSAGNSGRVERGREILIWATVGIIVIFTSYAVIRFVIEGLTTTG